MRAYRFNAPGIGGPEDADETFLELVAEFMECGMSQDDAEIAAVNKMEADRDSALQDAGEEAFERLRDDD